MHKYISSAVTHNIVFGIGILIGLWINNSKPVVIKEFISPPQETHLHFKGTTYNAIYTEKGKFDVELTKAKVKGIKVSTKDETWVKQGD